MTATHSETPADDEFVTEILARRKRRTPALTLALVVLVAAAAAFIGGIEAQKHWGHSSSGGGSGGGSSRAAQLSALASRYGVTAGAGGFTRRSFGGTGASGGGATGFGGKSSGGATGFGGSGGGGATGFGGGSGGASGFGGFGGAATIGTVTLIKGSTLYVTDSSGNTVKVKTSPSSTVTKTIQGSIKTVLPGQTVTILGTQGKDGTVTARSIAVSAARR